MKSQLWIAYIIIILICSLQSFTYATTIGYWRFENPVVINEYPYYYSWLDYSGRDHHAKSTDECSGSNEVFGSSIPRTGDQNIGSMEFPRWHIRSDWVIVNDHDDFDFDAISSFTVEMWLKFGTYSSSMDHQIILDGYNWPAQADGWGLYYDGANYGVKFALIQVGSIYLDATSDGALNDDKWHHIAGVREIDGTGEHVRLYVDGVLQTNDQTTYNPIPKDLSNSKSLWIGGADSPYCYGGSLDELRITRGVLDPTEFLNSSKQIHLDILPSDCPNLFTVNKKG
ncbi:MAG: LamG domain-containing protein, partial [Planctomycetota bacterium]